MPLYAYVNICDWIMGTRALGRSSLRVPVNNIQAPSGALISLGKMLVYITLGDWSHKLYHHKKPYWQAYTNFSGITEEHDAFSALQWMALPASSLPPSSTWVKPAQQVMLGSWRMDGPELLALSDVPMAQIVGDYIASPPALPLNGQRSSIPSPEVVVCKVQDL